LAPGELGLDDGLGLSPGAGDGDDDGEGDDKDGEGDGDGTDGLGAGAGDGELALQILVLESKAPDGQLATHVRVGGFQKLRAPPYSDGQSTRAQVLVVGWYTSSSVHGGDDGADRLGAGAGDGELAPQIWLLESNAPDGQLATHVRVGGFQKLRAPSYSNGQSTRAQVLVVGWYTSSSVHGGVVLEA
jgi:hypothetical protein